MRLLIEIPTWLGDSVMVTPAIENILVNYGNSELTFIGSEIGTSIFKLHPNLKEIIVIKNKSYRSLYQISRTMPKYDIFFSFRSSIRSSFLMFLVNAERKFKFDKSKFYEGHQVEKYNNFINKSLGIKSSPGKLIVYKTAKNKKNLKLKLGINPGASYGSAKRWYPEEFAKVAMNLADKYDIFIFGSVKEKSIANDIESHLRNFKIGNFVNLAGKTSILELINLISQMDLFITGDSGPMHLAAAFQIKTVSIFGPTDMKSTCQWMNRHSINLSKELECQPCMKRTCPLNHHNCMREIKSDDVLSVIN